MYRAIHTLSGSSKMAEARHGIRITEPLNHVMRKVFDSGHGFVGREAWRRSSSRFARSRTCCRTSMNRRDFFSDQPALLARFRDLEAEVDAMIASAARDTSASAMVPALTEPPAPPLPSHCARGARGGIRSRNREYLQRGGDRTAGSGSGFADGLESGPQGQATGRGAAAPIAHAQRRRANGGHHRHGRFES